MVEKFKFCMFEDVSINRMPTSSALIENELVTVLRDIGCSGVEVKKDLL